MITWAALRAPTRKAVINCSNIGSVCRRRGEFPYRCGISGSSTARGTNGIQSCFSYGDGTNKICGAGTATQSYYLAETGYDDSPATPAKSAKAFRYGEVAYLLDTGRTGDANKVWTQRDTDSYPILKKDNTNNTTPPDTPDCTIGSFYKLTLKGSATAAGSVDFALPADKIFQDGTIDAGVNYECTYLPLGTTVTLSVTVNATPEYEFYRLSFTPKELVTETSGEDGAVTYTRNKPSDVSTRQHHPFNIIFAAPVPKRYILV